MTNPILRRNLVANIDRAIAEYKHASLLDHQGLVGAVREIAVSRLLTPLLSAEFEGTGKIEDRHGQTSSETDLVVYSKKVLPPLMFSDRLGAFPLDGCFASIEVKSTLTASEWKTSIEKVKALRRLDCLSGRRTLDTHSVRAVIAALFAFSSDLTVKGELDRYKECDPAWATDPAMDAFCVLSKGMWFHTSVDKNHGDGKPVTWKFVPPTAEHEEVIVFLTSQVNAFGDALDSRGRPQIGPYLTNGPVENA